MFQKGWSFYWFDIFNLELYWNKHLTLEIVKLFRGNSGVFLMSCEILINFRDKHCSCSRSLII